MILWCESLEKMETSKAIWVQDLDSNSSIAAGNFLFIYLSTYIEVLYHSLGLRTWRPPPAVFPACAHFSFFFFFFQTKKLPQNHCEACGFNCGLALWQSGRRRQEDSLTASPNRFMGYSIFITKAASDSSTLIMGLSNGKCSVLWVCSTLEERLTGTV